MKWGGARGRPDSMAKVIANMTYLERVDAITRELHSPTGVKRADDTLESLINEYLAILGIREAAAARFGITIPAPGLSAVQPKAADKPPETPIKDDVSGTLARLLDLIDRYRTDKEFAPNESTICYEAILRDNLEAAYRGLRR